MLENIRLSFQGIWSHKMRSFLTMLGIIIGIAAIIAIVSTIKGSNEQIKKNFIGSGTNSVNVRLSESGDMDYDMASSGIPKGVPVLTEDTRQELAELKHVKEASLYMVRTNMDGTIFYNSKTVQGGSLIGADIHYLEAAGYVVSEGRHFMESDYSSYRKVAIIDNEVSRTLFSTESPIGKTLDISGEPFTVIGVMEAITTNNKLQINSVDEYYTYKGDEGAVSSKIVIPDTCWGIVMQYDEPQNAYLLADSTDAMSDVGKSAKDLLNANVTNKDNIQYRAEDLQKKAEENQKLSEATNRQLLWIAGISLLVGGIGVMNIMLVSVTERTREIGLKKAIGARKKKIMTQFLTEAAVLTSLGGMIGTIAGIAMAEIISMLSSVPVAISIPAVIIAIAFSMGIGLIFGLLPAYQAANLDPIIALRHE